MTHPTTKVTTEPQADADTLVRGLYHAVLRREPDADGLGFWARTFAERLDDQPAGHGFGDVLLDFLLSTEARRKLLARLVDYPEQGAEIRKLSGLRAATRSEILHPELAFPGPLVGLGGNCYAASLLDRFGCRLWSGPFDWIFSRPDMVCDCIEDGFETFLDQGQYRPIPSSERPDPDLGRVSHPLYESRYGITDPIFNHTDVDQPEGHAYLRRCVGRFVAAMGSPAPVRFLQVLPERHSSPECFERLATTLRVHCLAPAELLVVAIAEPGSEYADPDGTRSWTAPGAKMLRIAAGSPWRATRFDDLIDDLHVMRAVQVGFAELAERSRA